MAQIIQHKRGVLEDLNGVTPNVGELLVVTGSSISALADGLVFVGNSSSDITAVNRILTGSSTPDVTGGDYNNFVDGVPFYNTTDKKLEILAKGGNTNVVFTTNSLDFNGTGIVSSSAQVQSLSGVNDTAITIAVGGGLSVSSDNDFTLNQAGAQTITIGTNGSDIVSSSAQIDTLGFAKINGDGIVSQSAQITDIANSQIATSAAIIHTKLDFNGSGIVSGSDQLDADYLKANGEDVVSGSQQITLGGDLSGTANNAAIASNVIVNADVNASAAIAHTKLDFNGSDIVSSSAQIDTLGFAQINGDGLVSESAQITLGGDLSGTAANAAIASNVIVNADINASAAISHTKLDFNGSGISSGSLNFAISGGTGNDIVTVGVDALTFAGTTNEIETTVTDNQVQIGLPNDVTIGNNLTVSNDVSITGDLTVAGTTTTIDSATLDISGSLVRVNYGGGAVEGGIEVTDSTGTLATGSLLWDGTNDYWKGGAKGSEKRFIAEGGSVGTANRVSKFDAAGTIINSTITDDGTDVTISGELTVQGLANNSFVVTNGSAQLLEVTPSTDGDIIQWNGSSFVASRTIDGGSF